ncbi:MAG: monooxygenase [Burkholderiales bacterium]|nr:monooxygenase [Burkholderiales bacterium]
MITEYVLFDLPANMSREQVVESMRAVASKWRATPDLIRKTFVYDADARQTGAFYLWSNKAAALNAHNEDWRRAVLETFGSVPVIRYFETPLVVDNALGETIEETVRAPNKVR